MSGLFGSPDPPPMPEPPEPQPPAPMPDPESPEILEARRRAAADALKRRGRDSTIMSNTSLRASGSGFGAGSVGDTYNRRTTGGQ